MCKCLIIAIIIIASSTPSLANERWHHITSSKDASDEYSIKPDSSVRDTNKNDEKITIVVGKSTNKKTNQVELFKWYVTDVDCKKEYGNLVVLDLNGEFKYEASFAKGAGTVASVLAEVICDAGASFKKQTEGKRA